MTVLTCVYVTADAGDALRSATLPTSRKLATVSVRIFIEYTGRSMMQSITFSPDK